MALRFIELEVDDERIAHIGSKHGVTIDEVVDALEDVMGSIWDDDPDRGRRLYVWGRAEHRTVFVCLRPLNVQAGAWRLITAYPDPYP